MKDAAGTSGKTYHGLLGYVEVCKPATLGLENVDEFEKEDSLSCVSDGNLSFLYNSLESRGYVIGHRVMMSDRYWLPQKRRRLYFLGMHCQTYGITVAHGQKLIKAL